ncbi:MAG: pinensin family lanthipeptide [Cyclobacteriaceae bacterium]
MKQNNKMKLDGLSVKSFVTSIEDKGSAAVNGGLQPIGTVVLKTVDPGCGSGYHTCYTHLPTEGCSWDARCTEGLMCGPIIKL